VARPSAARLFLERELRRGARRTETWAGRVLVTTLLLASIGALFWSRPHADLSGPESGQMGEDLAIIGSCLAWLLLLAGLPSSVAAGVMEEADPERGDLLTVAGVARKDVAVGVAFARLALMGLVLVGFLPVAALATGFGGVHPLLDGMAISAYLALAGIEITLFAAWLAGAARAPIAVTLITGVWQLGLVVIAPLSIASNVGGLDVGRLLGGPLALFSVFDASSGGVAFELFLPVVHVPILLMLWAGVRAPAAVVGGVALLLVGPAGILLDMLGPHQGLVSMAALGLLAAAWTGLAGVAASALLRVWGAPTARGEPTPVSPRERTSAREDSRAERRWTGIWSDPIAWRETATAAYGRVNLWIGRFYIAAGSLAVAAAAAAALDVVGPKIVFVLIGFVALWLATGVTALAAAGSVLDERRSLDLLLISRLGPAGVVRGKRRAALLLAGPAAAVAVLTLPAAFEASSRSWGEVGLLPLVATYAVWLPVFLLGFGALTRLIAYRAQSAAEAWQRVAALWAILIMVPTVLADVLFNADLAWLAHTVVPWRSDVAFVLRAASTLAWAAVWLWTEHRLLDHLLRGGATRRT